MAQIPSGSKKLWSTLKRRYGFIGEKKLVVGFFVLVIGAIAIILWASCTVAGTTIARQRSEPVQNKYSELQKDDSGNSSSSVATLIFTKDCSEFFEEGSTAFSEEGTCFSPS